ncbi:MAG: biopolymer transporter ExbD [Oscillospiraceae bacterium]|nr:biopolymer transporter ExbD [Oscillospiraceae bacterium]
MKRRKISLDFTALLDITMIILFFFLINFKFSSDEAKAEAAAQIEEAAAQSEQLEADRRQFEEEKAEWQKEAEREMEKLREADKNAVDNAEALMNFQKGVLFKIDLKMRNRDDWDITVLNGSTMIGEVSSENCMDLKNEIITILGNNGFKKDDVIIAVFMYDLHDNGSGHIPEDFLPQIKDVNGVYEKFYCAEIRK